MTTEIRVLIADDHPVVRAGLRQALEAEAHVKVVAETGDGETTWKLLQELQPDVAVLDIYMPQADGFGQTQAIAFDLARSIQQEQLPIQVILLTGDQEPELFAVAMKLGVKGYLLKESAIAEIVKSVKAVAAGYHYLSPYLSGHLLHRQAASEAFIQQYPGLRDLTPREKAVLRLVALGQSSEQIATELRIGEPAINNHRAHICQKLGLEGPMALLRFVLAHKDDILRFCGG